MKNKFDEMTIEELTNYSNNFIDADELQKYYESLSKKIMERWITNMNISQKELARLTGLSTSSISAYKKGIAIPSLPIYLMIGDILQQNILRDIIEPGIDKYLNDMVNSLPNKNNRK